MASLQLASLQPSLRRAALALLLISLWIIGLGRTAYAAEPVTVEVASGRTYTGYVDSKTDGERLWLRFEGMATTIRRPVSWESIASATVGEEQLTAGELREQADALASDRAPIETIASGEVQAEATDDAPSYAEQAHAAIYAPPEICSIEIDAYLANWDGDVESDGVLLHVYPRDGQFRLSPVSGTLWVEVIGERPAATKAKYARTRGKPFPRLATWTKQLTPQMVTSQGAVYRLPFQALHPDFDLDLGQYAVVHARLTVPGEGVFEDSEGLVRVRRYSPIRDELQFLTRDRFFPTERTGRSN